MNNKTVNGGPNENHFCMKCPNCKVEIAVPFSKIKRVLQDAEGPCEFYKRLMGRLKYPMWKEDEIPAITLSALLYIRELRKANYGR